jgi:tRNA A37 methylthiotransferase MiaB
MPKKLYLETVGCQMNVPDSELVVGSLRRPPGRPTRAGHVQVKWKR